MRCNRLSALPDTGCRILQLTRGLSPGLTGGLPQDSEQQMILTARRSLVAKVSRHQPPQIDVFFLNIHVRRARLLEDSLKEVRLHNVWHVLIRRGIYSQSPGLAALLAECHMHKMHKHMHISTSERYQLSYQVTKFHLCCIRPVQK